MACVVFQRILSFLNHEHMVMYLAVEPSQAIVNYQLSHRKNGNVLCVPVLTLICSFCPIQRSQCPRNSSCDGSIFCLDRKGCLSLTFLSTKTEHYLL